MVQYEIWCGIQHIEYERLKTPTDAKYCMSSAWTSFGEPFRLMEKLRKKTCHKAKSTKTCGNVSDGYS